MSVVSLLYYTTTLIATFAILYHTCPLTRLAHHCWLGVWNMVVFFSHNWVMKLSVWNEVQIVCIWSSWCHCIPKPQPHLLLPHLNQDWFYLSGISLHRFSWERPFSSSSSSSSRNNVDSTFYCNVTEKMFCVPCLCHSLLRQRCIQLFFLWLLNDW